MISSFKLMAKKRIDFKKIYQFKTRKIFNFDKLKNERIQKYCLENLIRLQLYQAVFESVYLG